MKTVILSIMLGISVILGNSIAIAEMTEKASDKAIHTMGAASGQITRGSKGLDKPMVVPNGQESWVLHRPMERYPVYFNSTNEDQGNRQSGQEDNRENK